MEGFRGERGFLSNFYIATVMFEGDEYPSSEHAYQAAKCAAYEDRAAFRKGTPSQAKRRGRSVAIRPDWEQVKVLIMHDILLDKFTRHFDLREELLATGDAPLIEHNTWGDTFWGVCRGRGSNVLGLLLMGLRAEFQSAKGTCWKRSSASDTVSPARRESSFTRTSCRRFVRPGVRTSNRSASAASIGGTRSTASPRGSRPSRFTPTPICRSHMPSDPTNDIVPGTKLISITGQYNIPDDPNMPYRLDVNLRPPEFMDVAFVLIHGGTERCVVRGDTLEALDEVIRRNFLKHPRLRELTITGPVGEVFRHAYPVWHYQVAAATFSGSRDSGRVGMKGAQGVPACRSQASSHCCGTFS